MQNVNHTVLILCEDKVIIKAETDLFQLLIIIKDVFFII